MVVMASNPNSASTAEQANRNGAKVAIVTDSIAQVPDETARQLGILVVPYSVAVEDQVLRDLSDVNLSELYRRMRHEKDLRLTTSAPSIGEFYQIFTATLEDGAESVVYVGIASRLSHAFSSAVEAARMIHEEIGRQAVFPIDTRLATAAQGFLAVEAALLAQQGANPHLIIEHISSERRRAGFAAGLETLEYLARGGRIGKAAYMLGSAIRILPVVTLDDKGEVLPISKKFGYNRVLEDCLRYVREKVAGSRTLRLAVMHADVLQWAEKLEKTAVEQLHPDEVFITTFTPTMVAHTGPGIIGLAYHWKP
jgi:DegV family protein with EDD domain